MALTPSTMLELGTTAPTFHLPNPASGEMLSLNELADGRALLVMFICNHCPFVVHVRSAYGPLTGDFADQGLKAVAINSNNLETHPQDGPAQMAELVAEMRWDFPFLLDESQSVAKSYQAACTPDYFLFDAQLRLTYRGQLDGARPGNNVPVTGTDLREAIAQTLEGSPVSSPQVPSVGCNIKWKPGNEPAYFG